jgi:hypothetical protein
VPEADRTRAAAIHNFNPYEFVVILVDSPTASMLLRPACAVHRIAWPTKDAASKGAMAGQKAGSTGDAQNSRRMLSCVCRPVEPVRIVVIWPKSERPR